MENKKVTEAYGALIDSLKLLLKHKITGIFNPPDLPNYVHLFNSQFRETLGIISAEGQYSKLCDLNTYKNTLEERTHQNDHLRTQEILFRDHDKLNTILRGRDSLNEFGYGNDVHYIDRLDASVKSELFLLTADKMNFIEQRLTKDFGLQIVMRGNKKELKEVVHNNPSEKFKNRIINTRTRIQLTKHIDFRQLMSHDANAKPKSKNIIMGFALDCAPETCRKIIQGNDKAFLDKEFLSYIKSIAGDSWKE